MKNFVKFFIIIVILLTIILAIFSMIQINRAVDIAETVLTGHARNEKIEVARVIDQQNGVATFKTSDGLLYKWDIESGENFKMRSCYRVTLNTLGTSSPSDDIIISVEKN